MKARTFTIDGEYWFTAQYAASLLGTARKTVEAMAIRELIRSREEGNSYLIAETDVTRLRRDADALAAVKKAARMPAVPCTGETMPAHTVYKGDPPKKSLRVKGPVGNPLADGRKI